MEPILNKRVTIQDLAAELNTTASTVSRALRGSKSISVNMRERVLELAKKRNYKVNKMAANLRAGQSKTIGVIVPRINRDFFSNCISGIEDIAFEAGYTTIICQTHEKVEKEREYINALISSNVEGILVSITNETENYKHFQDAASAGIPIIFFDRAIALEKNNKVVVDDRLGAYKATSHLLKMGYKRIVHFAGYHHIQIYIDRMNGYKDALKEFGVAIDEKLILENVLTKETGRKEIRRLMEIDNPPDALFAASDYSALGALLELKEMNYNIPQDFGIVGFSNESFTSLITPSLTTVDQHSQDIGHYAAKICLEKIAELRKQVGIPRKIVLDPTLIVRESSLRRPLRS